MPRAHALHVDALLTLPLESLEPVTLHRSAEAVHEAVARTSMSGVTCAPVRRHLRDPHPGVATVASASAVSTAITCPASTSPG